MSMDAVKEVHAVGVKKQRNSLLFASPPHPTQHVVYFQGDVQVSYCIIKSALSISTVPSPPPHTHTELAQCNA